MILVDGLPVSDSSSPFPSRSDGRELLASLLEHPSLVSSSNILKATPARKTSISEGSPPSKHVYVFQKEYATVDPSLVELVGTDEATTCVGLVIRNRQNGMTSIAHLDVLRVVDMGLSQMLALVMGDELDATLDVHLIGGFEDKTHEDVDDDAGLNDSKNVHGYSLPLCSKIVDALQSRQEKFHIQTLCVLRHNTKRDSSGNRCPIISGFLVETSSGSIAPATFDRICRCPDEIVRRVRLTVSNNDPCWTTKLLETYDTHHDRFCIAPCVWMPEWGQVALSMLQLSDSAILSRCSTSPAAEAPDFVENERRMWRYLVDYPDWRQTFFRRRPRVFERTSDGGWQMIN